jgi:glyoxylase-like metal-dependent hydrolase (beta-lactamase superfamily II)
MIFDKTGCAADGLYVTGLPWSPVYLLDGARPVLFEAGFACMGRHYVEGIRSVVKEKRPEILFLTHVHWDHCGGTSYIRESFPGIKVAASERAASIIKRPNAQNLIKTLSKDVISFINKYYGISLTGMLDDPFKPFNVDMVLEDGQTIGVDEDLSVRVIATPGHTRDHLSYYIPERKILIATESSGVQDRVGTIVPEFLVDYDMYVASLKRLMEFPAEVLCQGHHFVFVGREEVNNFLARSLREAEHFKTHVLELLRSGNGSIEEAARKVKAEQYDRNPGPKQTEKAYLLNLRSRITHLAERFYNGQQSNETVPAASRREI